MEPHHGKTYLHRSGWFGHLHDQKYLLFLILNLSGSSSTIYAACAVKTLSSGSIRFAFFRSTNSGSSFAEVDLSSDIDVSELIRFEIGVTPAIKQRVFIMWSRLYEDGDGSNDIFLVS
jgi:hypothetical protein